MAFSPQITECLCIYCSECIENLQAQSNACWTWLYPHKDLEEPTEEEPLPEHPSGKRCMIPTTNSPYKELDGIAGNIYSKLRAFCKICNVTYNFKTEREDHLDCLKGTKYKFKLIEDRPDVFDSVRDNILKPLVERQKKIADHLEMDPLHIALCSARVEAQDADQLEAQQKLEELIQILELRDRGRDPPQPGQIQQKLSVVESSAMRVFSNLSFLQYRDQSRFLKARGFNLLPYYQEILNQDASVLPGNTGYILENPISEVEVYKHEGLLNPKPHSFSDYMKSLGPAFPKPR